MKRALKSNRSKLRSNNLDCCKVFILESDVLLLEFVQNRIIGIKELASLKTSLRSLFGGRKSHIIIDLTSDKILFSDEAKEYIAMAAPSQRPWMNYFAVTNCLFSKLQVLEYNRILKPESELYAVRTLDEALQRIRETNQADQPMGC